MLGGNAEVGEGLYGIRIGGRGGELGWDGVTGKGIPAFQVATGRCDCTIPDMQPPSSWQFLNSSVHAECKVFDILKNRFRHPKQEREADFYVVHSRPWANICAVTPDRKLVMIRQFRFGVQDFAWEFPGGIIDSAEDPVEAAVRELREETGYEGKNPRIIGQVWPNPAIQDNQCTLVRVDEATLGHPTDWDENEEIEVALVPYEELKTWGVSGKLKHSIALNQLYFLEKSMAE